MPEKGAAFLHNGATLPAKRIPAEPNVLTVDWAAAPQQTGGVLA